MIEVWFFERDTIGAWLRQAVADGCGLFCNAEIGIGELIGLFSFYHLPFCNFKKIQISDWKSGNK